LTKAPSCSIGLINGASSDGEISDSSEYADELFNNDGYVYEGWYTYDDAEESNMADNMVNIIEGDWW
jgi:hypothetical protein